MRVLTIINSLRRGGAEVSLLRLLTATQGAGIEHIVATLMADGDLESEFLSRGIEVVPFSFQRGCVPTRGIGDFARRIRALRPDLIRGEMYHGALAASYAKLVLPRSPLLWTIHHSLNGLKSESRSTRLALKACRVLSAWPVQIAYVSERSMRQHSALGFCDRRACVLPNGLDLADNRLDPAARQRLRAEWGFKEQDFVCGLVARVHPMKDHDCFISAIRIARLRNPSIKAVLCGSGTDLLSVPDDLNGSVRLLGERRDVPQIMSAVDIGCLSSAFGEALPNVLFEFMSCERPCITTRLGDAEQIVLDFGVVVEPEDPRTFAEAILRLAQMGEEARIKLGRAARQSIIERFDIRAVRRRHIELWRKTVTHETPSHAPVAAE
ncbi:MAG: glycosyltransferase [Parvibaculaceae bacterium]